MVDFNARIAELFKQGEAKKAASKTAPTKVIEETEGNTLTFEDLRRKLNSFVQQLEPVGPTTTSTPTTSPEEPPTPLPNLDAQLARFFQSEEAVTAEAEEEVKPKQCVYELSTGRCQTLTAKRYCAAHIRERCWRCNKQATMECEHKVPQCRRHKHDTVEEE